MNNIQKIIYINLDHRLDRKQEIESEFKRLNIPEEKIIRLSAVAHPYPNTGCNLSHAKALRLAHSLNLENVLILEDDFNFIDDLQTIDQNLNHFFQTIQYYDALLLTRVNTNDIKKVDDILSICNGSSNAAGYIVKNHMFLTLAEDFERSANLLFETKAHWLFQNDQVWQKYMKNDKWFCFNIHLGYQRKSFSNLANVVVFFGY